MEKEILEIATRLARTNINDINKLKAEGRTIEEIHQYLERKNFHILNMLSMAKNKLNWNSYQNIYHKAKAMTK